MKGGGVIVRANISWYQSNFQVSLIYIYLGVGGGGRGIASLVVIVYFTGISDGFDKKPLKNQVTSGYHGAFTDEGSCREKCEGRGPEQI